MRKVLNTAFAALLLTSIFIPSVSFADEPEPDTGSIDILETSQDDQHIDHLHSEIEQEFEDYSGVLIPPVVIRVGQPTDPDIYVLPTAPQEVIGDSSKKAPLQPALEQLGLISGDQKSTLDPYRHTSIPIDSLVLKTSTPTDEFMDGARIFGAVLALAAIGLFGATGVNTFRSRKRKSAHLF